MTPLVLRILFLSAYNIALEKLVALGFVFMFTIGGLIFHLAFPLKITICWELLTIILLGFYLNLNSVKMYNFEQSAGNLKIGKYISVGTS